MSERIPTYFATHAVTWLDREVCGLEFVQARWHGDGEQRDEDQCRVFLARSTVEKLVELLRAQLADAAAPS